MECGMRGICVAMLVETMCGNAQCVGPCKEGMLVECACAHTGTRKKEEGEGEHKLIR